MTSRYLALLFGLLLFNGAQVFAGTVKKKKERVLVLEEPEAYAQNLRSQTAHNALLRQQNKAEEQNFIVGKDTLLISAAAKAEANQLLIDFANTYAIEYYVAFVFEVQDASGQISSPVPNPTTVTEYGKRIFSNSKLGGTRSLLLTIKIEDWIYSDTSVVRHFTTDFRMGQNTICENLSSAGDYTFIPFSEGYDVAFLSYVNNVISMFEACIEAEGGTNTLAFVQEELIKEGLLYFKEEITFFLENKDKQGLDEEANARLASFPACLPKEGEALEGVLGKIEEYLVAPDDLLVLIKGDEAHKAWLEALSARLTGEDAPFSDKLEASEWSEWLGKMCTYLIEHIPVIEGVTRNPELVVIHSISEVFDPGKDRLMISYTLKDTLGLDYNTLEIYKLEEGDTTMVTFYSDLPKGVELDFIDSQDGNKIGWAGKGTNGEYVEDGLYRISIISAIDSLSTNGFIDYEQFEVKDINEPEFEITTDQLEDIFPDTDKERIKEVVEIINKYSNDYGLTTKTRMAHFLGQIGTETSGLEKLKESSNYSAKNIFNIFLKVKRKKKVVMTIHINIAT